MAKPVPQVQLTATSGRASAAVLLRAVATAVAEPASQQGRPTSTTTTATVRLAQRDSQQHSPSTLMTIALAPLCDRTKNTTRSRQILQQIPARVGEQASQLTDTSAAYEHPASEPLQHSQAAAEKGEAAAAQEEEADGWRRQLQPAAEAALQRAELLMLQSSLLLAPTVPL